MLLRYCMETEKLQKRFMLSEAHSHSKDSFIRASFNT